MSNSRIRTGPTRWLFPLLLCGGCNAVFGIEEPEHRDPNTGGSGDTSSVPANSSGSGIGASEGSRSSNAGNPAGGVASWDGASGANSRGGAVGDLTPESAGGEPLGGTDASGGSNAAGSGGRFGGSSGMSFGGRGGMGFGGGFGGRAGASSGGAAGGGGTSGVGSVTFEQVRTLLATTCNGAACHDAGNSQGTVDLTSSRGLYGRLTSPLRSGNCPDETMVTPTLLTPGLLLSIVQNGVACGQFGVPERRQPPNCSTTSNNPRACLTPAQIQLISDWIAEGAPM